MMSNERPFDSHGPATAGRGRPRLDDAEAMRAIAAGDVGAVGALYDRHGAAVRAFLIRGGTSPDDASDVTQDVFLTVLKVAVRYDGRPSARPFLLGIAARHARRVRERVRRWSRALTLYLAGGRPETELPDARRLRADRDAAFEGALAKLSERKRTVFLMVEREGLSGEEAASALGIPVNTVWTRLHSARAELTVTLRKRGAP
jgi:RNA polymerase sigma-70 factor (ECF subfamily)